MSLKAAKVQQFESAAEARFYAGKIVPRMYKGSVHMMPLLLTVPLFSIARNSDVPLVDAVWHRPGVGFVRYRGKHLTQSHQSVFLALVKSRAGQVVSNAIDFFPSELLAAMGWSNNSRNISRLRSLIDDLSETRIRVWTEGQSEDKSALRANLFIDWKPAENPREHWYIRLHEDMMQMFVGRMTYLNIEKRALLQEGLAVQLSFCKSSETMPSGF